MLFDEQSGPLLVGEISPQIIRGRTIHDNNLVGSSIQKSRWNGVGSPHASNAFHLNLVFAKVFEIHSRNDRDAGIEQLLYILPAVCVWTCGRIFVRQPVDQGYLWLAADYGRNVNRFPVAYLQCRNSLKSLQN